ncbi:MAG: DUF2867 domain-containing protein [Phreatobacter sp.]|uniref:DUF2867 domain-containing protein n=1 Tax=Phreatobacter sp. TaxID=1966341 RepID=UPI001A5CD2FA|nr:DUF2867 domain-containing protein [Phreatobacter sp.]MBL8571915.1 DUF2867 domain-containing protein [Phreatobacter sp.]
MQAQATGPASDTGHLLEGADFSDTYGIAVEEPDLDAIAAARHMMARTPRWVAGLLVVRNLAVAPFGLRGAPPERTSTPERMGFFPVISQTPERVVLGFDDRHLDFRVVVDVMGDGATRRVMATTLVRTHNLFGRGYLKAVLPFHRMIVPAMLRRVARP